MGANGVVGERLRAENAGDAPHLLVDDLKKCGLIFSDDLYEEIELAGGEYDVHDVAEAIQCVCDDFNVPLGGNAHHGHAAVSQLEGVGYSDNLDDTAVLKAHNPATGSARGEADEISQLGISAAPVSLQRGEELPVDLVDLGWFRVRVIHAFSIRLIKSYKLSLSDDKT